jgi:hypothetical protein
MPDWIDDQMARAGPEATLVFGRNAQIAATPATRQVRQIDPLLSFSIGFTMVRAPKAGTHAGRPGNQSRPGLRLFHGASLKTSIV